MDRDLIMEKEINEAIVRSGLTSAQVAPILARMAEGQRWAAERESRSAA
jgi:predicted nuclease with TOPRIM domain